MDKTNLQIAGLTLMFAGLITFNAVVGMIGVVISTSLLISDKIKSTK